MQLEQLDQIRKQSVQLYDAAQISAAYDQMANEIARDLSDLQPLVICVMNGGLVVTAELLRRMDFPLELDYVHITRYQGNFQGGEMQTVRLPDDRIKGRPVLIIDDILDEGITLKYLQQACSMQGAVSVHTAVLVIKQHDRRVDDVSVDYSGILVEDRYVYGCGMDYQGFFRNLNEIYAVDDPGQIS